MQNSSTSSSNSNKPTQPTQPTPPDTSTHSAVDWSQLDLALLQIDPRLGLTDTAADHLRSIFGYNEIVEPKGSRWKRLIGYFTGSIAYLIEAAAILSAALRDWLNFGIISALLLVNALIGYWEEEKAEDAVDALKSTLALRCRLMRGGRLRETEARVLVPGDVVQLRNGDVVSADAIVLPALRKDDVWKGLVVENNKVKFIVERPGQGERKVGGTVDEEVVDDEEEEQVTLQVDQSALTGESLPVNKHPGDLLYSSSLIKAGQASALVIRTGQHTFIGRAASLIAITTEAGHFQKVIQRIGNFLIYITVLLVSLVFVIGVTVQHHPITRQLQSCLVICIASIPVALPTVLSVTMAVGAQQLARKEVIVKRLTAVEEMAGMDVLCSDKTGTLTKNQISTDEPYLVDGHTEDQLLLDAFLASEHATSDAIDLCLRQKAIERVDALHALKVDEVDVPGWHLLSHTPFNATSKIATSVVRRVKDGRVLSVMKGAPQKVFDRCDMSDDEKRQAEQATVQMALKGLRALAVAESEPYVGKRRVDELRWHCVGCLSLLDPPREDSAETIRRLHEFGIAVKMITGDTILIAREIARRLGLQRNILSPHLIQRAEQSANITAKQLLRMIEAADGFAQVVPEDKYRVVELLQLGDHLVGMTGDALKKANVGIAVHGCTDAARAAAAIVLLRPGLGTICDGVVTSRAIFQRMQSYSLYRITSTIHFLLFLFMSILIFDFSIPAVLIVLITVMNDAATLVISVDNAQISRQPDKWRLGQLIFLSFLLASLLTASSFAHFLIFRALHYTTAQLGTVLYLQLSSSPHFVIFSTRVPGPWYSNMPGLRFTAAILGTQLVAMLFAVYGVVSAPIGWSVSAAVMTVSLLVFMLLDVVKCAVYRWWSLDSTLWMWPSPSRRERVKERREERERKERMRLVVRRVRRVMHAVWFLRLLREARMEGARVGGGGGEGQTVEGVVGRKEKETGDRTRGTDHAHYVEMVPLDWDEKSSLV